VGTFWSNIWKSLGVAVIISATVVAFSVRAATLSSGNDYVSTLQAGQAANHQLIFTTPSGISVGETVTITFASSFDTSSITEDDVDVTTSSGLTTAAVCGGGENMSVSIASDVLTLTSCNVAIASAAEVTIDIGTSATTSGTGTNQITNPSGSGTYFVTIAGTFGDSGSIALPIGGDDSVSVTGSFTNTTPGGETDGGGGTDTPDTAAPIISDIVVSEITTTSATISWTTSEAATSNVDYGETSAFELGTESSSSYRTAHSLSLSGLSEATAIYFQIRSSDIEGNEGTSSTQTFTTLDETAPVISNVEVTDVTTTTATITWDTDEPADSLVSYGLTTSYGSTEEDEDLAIEHSVTLTGLTEGTDYHFQVLSADSSSNQSYSDDETFTTESDEPPANVSALAVAEGDTSLSISWINPTDEDFAGVVVLICEGGYPEDESDASCTEVYDGSGTSVEATGLTNDVAYYVGVFAYDEAGQFASGALGTGTPSASGEEPPDTEEGPGEEPTDTGGEITCGDLICDESEDADSCPVDCSVGDTCGDGVCSDTEDIDSCPADCSEGEGEEEPTALGAEVGDLSVDDLSYWVAENTIELTPADTNAVDVLPTRTLRIQFPASELLTNVERVTLELDGDLYLMDLDETLVLYSTDVTTPDSIETYLIAIEVTYDDEATENVSSLLRVIAEGYVYQVIDGEEAIVPNVTVSLLEVVEDEPVVWDGSPYAQFNPTNTTSEGNIAWYVPNGTFMIQAEADGFDRATSSDEEISNNIMSPVIRMVRVEEEEEEPEPVIEPGGPTEVEPEGTEETETGEGAPAASVLSIILDSAAIEAVQEALEFVRGIPGVQEAAEISVPTLAVTAGASVVVLSVAFDFLPFLQYLFTAPILFFWRRKRKGYGVVYNAISKVPVDLAVVRLFRVTEEDEAQGRPGRLVKSRVTDKGGRYFFLVAAGRYRMTITKAGHQFPSEYLDREQVDGSFLDLYHGEAIDVSENDAVITANIPMDPSQAEKYQAPKNVLWRTRLRMIQHSVAILGVIASTVFAVIRPNAFSLGMVGVQVGVYLLARRLARPRKPISWGIVYDQGTGRPLSRVVARVFEPKYNKLLETQLTDSKGRYAFMLGPNQYYATFKKDGFEQQEIQPIDYTSKEEPEDFSQDLELRPEEGVQPPQESSEPNS